MRRIINLRQVNVAVLIPFQTNREFLDYGVNPRATNALSEGDVIGMIMQTLAKGGGAAKALKMLRRLKILITQEANGSHLEDLEKRLDKLERRMKKKGYWN